jgi:hypothetical protein
VKGHAIDPFSFVFGLLFALLGWFFLTGDRSVADIGSRWIWPVTILTLGLLMVLYAAKRIYSGVARSQRPHPTAELESENQPQEPD